MKSLIKTFIFTILLLPAASVSASDISTNDDLDSLLSIDYAKNQSSKKTELPYSIECRKQSADKLKCTLTLDAGAYVYKDSIKVTCNEGIAVIDSLPLAQEHRDPNGVQEIYKSSFSFDVNLIDVKKDRSIQIYCRGCDKDGICYPENVYSYLTDESYSIDKSDKSAYSNQSEGSGLFSSSDNFLLLIALALLLGAALDLTPCVFPMLTIYSATILGGEYISKSHCIRQNVSYLSGLAMTYCLAGILFSEIGVIAHSVLQHPVSVCTMAAALFLFALDCMGVVTLKVPALFNSSLQNKINEQKAGTKTKAFVFGALSALITTPCTSAPLAGALIYVMNSNSLLKGSLLFLSIGIGMGLPLVLIGIFGNKFISAFKGRGAIVRKLIAIPLFIAAVLVTEHLYQEYVSVIKALVYSFCIAYTLYVFKDLLKLKAPLTICTVIFLISFAQCQKTLQDPVKLPFTNIENVMDLNKYQGKKILLTISADWCSNCHALDSSLYATDEFKQAMSNVQLLRYDFTDPKSRQSIEFAKKFNLIGVPFAAILDKNQNVVKTFTGGVSLEELQKSVDF